MSASAAHARTEKAVRLEFALRTAGISDPTDARSLTAEERRAMERRAGTRVASDETWELVFGLLASWPAPQQETP